MAMVNLNAISRINKKSWNRTFPVMNSQKHQMQEQVTYLDKWNLQIFKINAGITSPSTGLQCTKRHSELATILVKHNGRSTHFFCCASCCGGRVLCWWRLSSISLVNHVETTWLGSRNLHCRPLATLMEGLLATCNISTRPRTEAFAMKWTEHDGTKKLREI